jgi:yeast amino acid transporter
MNDHMGVSEDKSVPVYNDDKDMGIRTSSSDAEVGHGAMETVGTTKRGLKARHAQMIALGGTIG